MSAVVVDRLLRASIEGTFVVLFVALICRLVPSLPARHRAALWWLAAAKLLFALAPVQPLELPLLPPPVRLEHATESAARLTTVAPASPAARPKPSPERWLLGLWAAGLLLFAAGSSAGAIRARRLRRSGRPLRDPALLAQSERAARKLGLARTPEVLLVPGLPGPLVTGLVAPSILLPETAVARLDAAELEMVLEHELAHVARRDLWLGIVPAAARRVFFFHPLAWWIEREYAVAREAACDDAVVTHGGADAFTYGTLLLRLATGRHASTAALSPRSMLRRRLEMIERTANRKPLHARVVWILIALAAAGFVPVRLVARDTPAPEAPAAPATAATEPTPAALPAPAAAPAMRAPLARAAAPPPASGTPSPTPVAAPLPAPRATTVYKRSATSPPPPPPPPASGSIEVPDAPEAPAPPPAPAPAAFERCLDLGKSRDSAFVITDGDSHTMCGDIRDIQEAEHARGKGDDIIWFRVDGQSYVVRDRGTVVEARETFRAQNLVGTEQSSVGDVQSAIGDKQAAIGEKQAQLAQIQAKLADEMAASGRDAEVQAKMNALSARMNELNAQMRALSEQQAELGARQGALGEKMRLEGSDAQRRLTEILERALESGRAAKIQ
ncbi:MAG TPA: M56 family metallopeptidase [Candidatus Polarisedimenticolaceae bacterium]|nr:M56 family metallopeptidase [Candidatus Polarisedimenticolaceae bacterium]